MVLNTFLYNNFFKNKKYKSKVENKQDLYMKKETILFFIFFDIRMKVIKKQKNKLSLYIFQDVKVFVFHF